jgi:hypothetical protein
VTWLLYVALLAAGFCLGRVRSDCIVSWAEDWTAPGWRTWRFWPAAPVAVACLALVWITHPRRTLANVRAWRQPPPARGPALTFDPDWAAKRRAEAAAIFAPGRVECGMSSGQGWWCRLLPGHSGGCIPRRDGDPS